MSDSTISFSQKTIKEALVLSASLIGYCCLFLSIYGCEKVELPTATASLPFVIDTSLVVHTDSTRWLPNKGIVTFEGQPFTGIRKSTFPDRARSSLETFYQGIRQGTVKRWYPSGVKSYEAYYVNGKLQGQVSTWWPAGNVRSESVYDGGELHGEQWQWYRSGAKFKCARYDNGVAAGLQQSWRENGKLYNNYEVVEGRVFGLKKASLCYSLDQETIQYE